MDKAKQKRSGSSAFEMAVSAFLSKYVRTTPTNKDPKSRLIQRLENTNDAMWVFFLLAFLRPHPKPLGKNFLEIALIRR